MPTPKQEHIELAARLQDKLLQYYEKKLDANLLTDTGAANLQRLLMVNGWSLDPNKLSDNLKGKLTQSLDSMNLSDEDEDYIAGAIGH